MTYDYELKLMGSEGYTKDSIGNQIPTLKETTVLCKIKSVSRSEFYNSAKSGLKPEIIFVVHGYEYNEEKQVNFEDVVYNVIRTYATDFEEVELVCERIR
ncbi:MAG TPA: phage head-tail adapter protein [Clostridiales bacterium]|nr:MAG: phage head-tail adapter protein [Clostridiales bacterium GWD2_32_59]HAN09366.1 phage head-tail adapter protein [Clostridiales bacterium]